MDREIKAKQEQNYDPNPPYCHDCVYFSRQARDPWVVRPRVSRNGKVKMIRYARKSNPSTNPLVDKCTFGNFLTKPYAVCDEWHSRQGERLE